MWVRARKGSTDVIRSGSAMAWQRPPGLPPIAASGSGTRAAIEGGLYRIVNQTGLIHIKEGRWRPVMLARLWGNRSNAVVDWRAIVSLILALGLLTTPAPAQEKARGGHHIVAGMMGSSGAGMMGADMKGSGGAGMMGAGMMGGGMMGGGMGMAAAMAGHVEGRLAFLKAELKITDAQMPLWDKFATAVRDNSKAISEVVEDQRTAAATARLPDRLALREKLLRAQLAAVQRLKAAADPLYAALSPEQKKTADELSGPMSMMM